MYEDPVSGLPSSPQDAVTTDIPQPRLSTDLQSSEFYDPNFTLPSDSELRNPYQLHDPQLSSELSDPFLTPPVPVSTQRLQDLSSAKSSRKKRKEASGKVVQKYREIYRHQARAGYRRHSGQQHGSTRASSR